MRLEHIEAARERVRDEVQPLPECDISDAVGRNFRLVLRESLKRRALRLAARPFCATQQTRLRRLLGEPLGFEADVLTLGDRFADDASWSYLLSHLPRPLPQLRVLIPGCYMGNEDVQFWLRRRVKSLHGIDIYSLARSWSELVPLLERTWGVPVAFSQGSIEDIPFEDNSFDIIATQAVLEHVRNLDRMVDETARVMAPGAMCFHAFGPLYYAFGGDHCISAYGDEAGYDHLLLSQDEYRARVDDCAFYAETAKEPDLPFWALHDQFSFAQPPHYLAAMRTKFEICHVVAKLSERGLVYRDLFPEKWRALRAKGLSEATLLVKSLNVVARRL